MPPHRFEPFTGAPVIAASDEVVLVCGTKALDVLRHAGAAPKNRSLNSLREQAFRPWDGGWYFVTFDPAIVDNELDKQQLIDWDLRLAVRFLTTNSLEPPIGEYRWVPGFSELIGAINCRWEQTGKPVEVSLDTETMGLYPWYKDKGIVSIGFTLEAGIPNFRSSPSPRRSGWTIRLCVDQ